MPANGISSGIGSGTRVFSLLSICVRRAIYDLATPAQHGAGLIKGATMADDGFLHDENDTEWWREYLSKYGMEDVVPEPDATPQEGGRKTGAKQKKKGWSPFVFIGVSYKLGEK